MQIYQKTNKYSPPLVSIMTDELKEACGVFGAQDFSREPAFPYIYWGLVAQNHRGHQSHGFITFDGKYNIHRALDLVPEIGQKDIQNWLERLPGHVGIGNVRYTTSGGTDEESIVTGMQPTSAEAEGKKIAISFNGNVVNSLQLRREIEKKFGQFPYACDAELICRKLLMKLLEEKDISTAAKECIEEVDGAFSVTGITQNGELFAFRDSYGIRPLCCGYSKDKDVYAFSSESVGLDINGFEYDSEVKPGEFIAATKDGFMRQQLIPSKRRALCAFEFAYFARPDSTLGNKHVYEIREEFGRNLAREYPEVAKKTDIVISIPETGDDAAYGMHEETGKRWERASRRHRYVTRRAFILLKRERFKTIDRKINILDRKLNGKSIAATEDSIVRGDTTKTIVQKLRNKGAKEVHIFVTFPRIIGPCFYGVDMATYTELIGSAHNAEEIAEIIGADTVNYQSIDGFIKATELAKEDLCLGCVTGQYPTPLAQKIADRMKERFLSGHQETGRLYEIESEIPSA